MKKLYVGCGLKLASPEFVTSVLELKDVLRRHFSVLDFHGLRDSDHNIFLYDMERLQQCEAMLAICDEPSFGLGFEVATVLARGFRVVAVARRDTTVSGLVEHIPEALELFSFHRYDSLEEIPDLLNRTLF